MASSTFSILLEAIRAALLKNDDFVIANVAFAKRGERRVFDYEVLNGTCNGQIAHFQLAFRIPTLEPRLTS